MKEINVGKATLPATSFRRNINLAVSVSKEISCDNDSSSFKNLQITVWNVNKLRRHSGNPDFKKFCSSYDIVCLIELGRKTKKIISVLFETHGPFSSVRSAQNHYLGGIIVYVKKEIHGCERIFEDCVVLKMHKNVFSLERGLILGAVYFSEGSTVYNSCEKGGIGLLKKKFAKLLITMKM